MGREARCACRWGERTGHVTIRLEPPDLIVHGDFRARVPLASIDCRHVEDALETVIDGERVAFELGGAAAARWVAAIAAPTPTLARKLGIAPETRVRITGTPDEPLLSAALAAGRTATAASDCDLEIVLTDDIDSLVAWAAGTSERTAPSPAWIVYVKGRGAPLGETAIRETMRSFGFIDTKVAGVSERLTALRFVKRR
jgi:hypothetical protein